ncbi:MAG: Ldh family oxidoreductase [Deltaproteobacteria bacterium]|nr:Ldh family oxidoreductase [Deltaproteobacteria bacterium]MBW2033859.1 Ldh family oxidoreductase [Deltaproteobacteria bacterium]MBW2345393.1 Ldh family oxidoreductase [Deltaproteobacteria bacterium]
MADPIRVDHADVRNFIFEVLKKEGVDEVAAGHVAGGLVHASLRGVDSHGIRLLPHYLKALKSGRINPRPNYRFDRTTHCTGVLDADNAYGHAAGMEAVKRVLELAGEAGMGAVAVKRSTHFGAASFFGLEISRHGMIGMSFTHADSLIVPTAGTRRFLGNNPICFTAPCEGEDPICLDMATSVITFNKVLQLREEGSMVPAGVGADKTGRETTNPHEIVNLLPVGGYKGYGLSLMIEILCALLTQMPFGPHIPRMYDALIEEKRNLGHFFMAIRVDAFEQLDTFKRRMKELVTELRQEPSLEPDLGVQVAGDPEKRISEERKKKGIPLRTVEVEFFKQAAVDYGVKIQFTSLI